MSFKLNEEQIERLSQAGQLAPSGGNNQPWQVEVDDDTFNITLDPSRMDNHLDSGKMVSIFSLGFFVENLIQQAAAMNLKSHIVTQEGKQPEDFKVIVKFTDSKRKLSNLSQFIPGRVTNRKPWDGYFIDESIMTRLRTVVEENKLFHLRTVKIPQQKKAIAEVVGVADMVRMTKLETLKEMLDEFRFSKEQSHQSKDGLDVETLELPKNVGFMFQLLDKYPFLTTLIPKEKFGETAKPLLLNSSHIGLVTTSSPFSLKLFFDCGLVCERLWLAATKEKLAIHPWFGFVPFYIEAQILNSNKLSDSEKSAIKTAAQKLAHLLGIEKGEYPLFITRISKAKSPITKSLRIPWREYTRLD